MTTTLDVAWQTPDAALSAELPRRTLRGVAVPFGVPSGPASNSGLRYRFAAPPENVDEAVDLVREHDDDRPIGRVMLEAVDGALRAVARVFTTRDGDDALVEAVEGARASFSAGVEILESAPGPDGVIDVLRWRIQHLGHVRRPAFDGARILDVAASAATTTEGNSTMADEIPVNGEFTGTLSGTLIPTAPEVPEDAAPADAPSDASSTPTDETLGRRRVSAAVRLSAADVAAMIDARVHSSGAPSAHPLARFVSLSAYRAAVRAGDVERFALVDQITTNNPGVLPPHWVTEVKGIVSQSRPVIEAFGVEAPGESGMDVSWPYFDGDIDAIVAEQATEKTEVNSVRIDIKKGSADLATLSAASDISYQLLTRSSPSYQEAHDRIMFAAYGAKSNAVAALSAFAAASGEVSYDPALDDNGVSIRAALLEASVKVELATGLPASFVLAGTTKFVELGSAASVWPGQYGTQNATGTGDAASLAVNLSGLPVLHARHLAADAVIVSNAAAASWFEVGPFPAVAEDVAKLGRDVAVWGMGAFGSFTPAGIVKLTATPPAARRAK